MDSETDSSGDDSNGANDDKSALLSHEYNYELTDIDGNVLESDHWSWSGEILLESNENEDDFESECDLELDYDLDMDWDTGWDMDWDMDMDWGDGFDGDDGSS
jgi:hypothetical protein